MKELEEIIKYLDQEVIGEERQALEKELLNNPERLKKVELIKEVDSTLSDEDYMTYVAKLNEVEKQFRSSEEYYNDEVLRNKKIGPRKLKIRWQYLSIAAVGIVFIISTFIYKNIEQPSNEELFKQFYSKYEANILTRSDTNENNDLVNAIQSYDRGNYKEAILNFKNILKMDGTNTAAHFFLGVSYMETNNIQNAIENLKYVITQNDTVFVEHAEWYMAMCYIKTNQPKLAIPILNKISNSNNYYKIMASDLLKKIK